MPRAKSKLKSASEPETAAASPSYELRGGCGQLFNSTEQEVILAGPADSGKTIAAVLKAHAICGSVPGAQGAIVRKAYNSLVGTVVKSFIRIVQPRERGIQIFGGEKPERFIYPNGSCIWMGGMDNPTRVLSSERDFIYVNQAEELTLNDWETLATRCSGRAAVVRHAQLFGDCNPSGSKHWIRSRANENRLLLLASRHQDNPTLFTRAGNLLDTEDARRRMAALENLSGVRRKRLLEGLWASAEGAVYDMFNSTPGGPHVKKRERSEMKRFFLAIDDGYTNPAVILDIGEDSDGRWHCFREFYQRGQPREVVVATARQWHGEHPTELVAVDEAVPELIAQLGAFVLAKGGKGKIIDGIRKVQDRLKVQGDGLSRYTVDSSCINHINEFESYVWKPEQDVPIKENDHSLDALRYLEDVLTEPTGAWTAEAVKQAAVDAPLGHQHQAGGWQPPHRVFASRRLF